MAEFLAHRGHKFWPDDVTLFGAGVFTVRVYSIPCQVNDIYLLALAAHKGALATFDRQIVTDADFHEYQA